MFDRRRFQVYYCKTGADSFLDYIAVTPDIENIRDHVLRLFVEKGVSEEQAEASLKQGMPFAKNIINYSKSEIEDFLYLAIFQKYGSWDSDSVAILKVDPKNFLDETYQKVLATIGRAQSRRFWISDFFGRKE